jgi:hypothetical protein
MPHPHAPDPDRPDELRDEESDRERAEEIYEEVGAENPDPVSRREAIEGELEEEGLSDEGGLLGEHIE